MGGKYPYIVTEYESNSRSSRFVLAGNYSAPILSLGNVFSWGVIGFLDEISLEYDVLSNFSTPVDLFNYTERRNNPTNIDAQIIFQYMVPTKIKENEASWWYHYRLVFYCYYGNAHVNRVGTPILNTDLDTMKKDNVTLKLRSVEQRLNYYLRQGVDIVNVFNIRSLSYNVLGFSMEDPIKSTTPFLDGPPTPPPTVSPSYYNNENDDVLFNDTSQWNNDGAPPDGTDDERDESGDGEGTMHPPSSSQHGPNNHSKVNDPYTNDQVTYPDFITYTSPVNVQSWVRAALFCLLCRVAIVSVASNMSTSSFFILRFFGPTGLAPISRVIRLYRYIRWNYCFDTTGLLSSPKNYGTNDLGKHWYRAGCGGIVEYGMEIQG